MTIGEKIKELRRKNDLTQEKLADYLCVSYQAVSKWECGLTNPDLSLIGPLTKLFNVTSDELLGLEKEKVDKRYEELKELFYETFKSGDLKKRLEITRQGVIEYPSDMFFLNEYGWSECMSAFEYKDDKEYQEAIERGLKCHRRVIEDCKDNMIRNDSIYCTVQYLSYLKRFDEAKKYAEMYPETESFSKNEVVLYTLTGEERAKHKQMIVRDNLLKLINSMDINDITSINAIESIINIFIPDKNYQDFYGALYENTIIKARKLVKCNKFDESLECLKIAKCYAIEYDKCLKNDKVKYTSPFFDKYEINTCDFMKSGTGNSIEWFIEELNSDTFNVLKDNEEFKTLSKL